jgi:hypothetical protein
MTSIPLAHAPPPIAGIPSPLPLVREITARDYGHAFSGKVMVIDRKKGAPLVTSDFFQLDDVGTHPSGLIVTGLFENGRRSHMMASAVRLATWDEIEWRRASQN